MKKIFLLLLFSGTFWITQAQCRERIAFATAVGTGVPVDKPASTPFTWQVLGYYSISARWVAGIGSGVSLYEEALIPLFADAKFALSEGRKFTPYLECSAGYSFAPDPYANGGIYLNPSVGVHYSLGEKQKLFLAFGYEWQKLERLKRQERPLFTVEFTEKLNHHTVAVKVGYIF